jgi:hypothetical protein
MNGLRPTRPIWALVIAAVPLMNCRRAAAVDPPGTVVESRDMSDAAVARRVAERRAHEVAWFQALPTCLLPPLGDTVGWRATYPGGVKLPPTFVVDPAASRGFMHGGRVWRNGSRTYTQTSEHWAFSSFQHDSLSYHCRVPLGEQTILFSLRESTTRYQASAWVVDTMPKTLFTTLHSATGPRSERLFVLHVLQTTPLPVR